jgi:hypothetical protein
VAVSLFDTMTVIMGYQLTHARFRYVAATRRTWVA